MKPPIAWYGGKTKLAAWVISHFPPHRIYVEPFGGSGAVLFAKKPAKIEVYNDLDLGVVNFYRCLRDPAKAAELQRLLELTPYSREEFNACRKELKESEPLDKAGCVRYAWVFAVTALQGMFGAGAPTSWGVQGVDLNLEMNARPVAADSFCRAVLKLQTKRLASVHIECEAWGKTVQRHDTPDTLIYADPPYTDDTGDSSYTHKVDHRALLDWVLGCKSMVVLSGMDNPLYNEALGHWERAELGRAIFATATSRQAKKRKVECLWLNPACQAARLAEQPVLF